jgi:hypothetical protein
MTETTRTVFEKYQVRKTKKQKTDFIRFVQSEASAAGWDSRVEKGALGARNIVVGDPDRAKVIYTAHYDTCARLPFPNFITPKSIGIYVLYQIALTVVLLAVPFLLMLGLGALLAAASLSAEAAGLVLELCWLGALVAEMGLIMAGPANKHTANDNTSGVTVLLDLLHSLPADRRDGVALVFFDLEEMGLFGSSGFASKHKTLAKNTLLVNFDCVSDGDTILFALQKKAKPHAAAIEKAFPATEDLRVEVVSKGVFYPSDQANFRHGVGVAALKRTRRGLLYMDRIHTKGDTVYEEKNIRFLTEGAIRLSEIINGELNS